MTSIHLCTSASWGGLELYACTLMEELRRTGQTVIGVCLPGSQADGYLKERGIPTAHLPGGPPWLPAPAKALRRLIAEHDAGVVHVHFHRDIWPASFALSGDRRCKLFLGIYLGVPKKNDMLHRIIYRRVDAIFTSSKELCRRLPSLYPVPPEKIHYLPYGRRIGDYVSDPQRRREIRSALGVGENELLVGTMVRIDPGKGVGDFVTSYELLDEDARQGIRYVIVGEPTRQSRTSAGQSPFEPHCVAYMHSLEQFVASHGLADRVQFAGYQRDYIGYLGAFDLFVFPSRDELYSLVVLDAQAMRLPVVAAAAGGTLDQIRDEENGLLYPVGDSAAMARQIARYVRDPSLRREHGAKGRLFVEQHHAMELTIAQLRSWYGEERHQITTAHSHGSKEHSL